MGAVKISGITALLSFIYIHTKPQWITQTIILDIQRHKRSFIVQLLNNQGLTKKYSITAVNAPKIID